MAETYYAWSNIRYGADRDETDPTVITKYHTVPAGSKVTAEKLGLTKDQFQELVESRAVRTMPFPKMGDTFAGSPVEWYREQAKKASEDLLEQAMESQEAAHAAVLDTEQVAAEEVAGG